MEDTTLLCPECGYPSPLPGQCLCAECGKSLRVELAAGRPVDATRFFAIFFFAATLGPLGAELLSYLVFFGRALESFRQSGLALQIYVLTVYVIMLSCASMAAVGLVLSIRFKAPRVGTQRKLRWLAILSLVGVTLFYVFAPILRALGLA